MDATNNNRRGEVMVRVAIEPLLARLKSEVLNTPQDARAVPNKTELANALGVGRATLYNLMNGTTQHVDLNTMAGVLNELRARGFEVGIADLFTEAPKEAQL
jgi:hypothetical protein